MSLFYYMLEIWESYFSLSFMRYWFFPIVAFAFIATLPVILRKLATWR